MKTTGTNPDIEILYEDNHLLAVNKPAGILSQEDYSRAPDILSLCKAYLKQNKGKSGSVFLGLLHRLDRNVGGVMVLAKTTNAASKISHQIKNRQVNKTYLAIVDGRPPVNGFFQHYLVKNEINNTVFVSDANNKKAKLAELMFIKIGEADGCSLIKITLITGRPHQIRVQFSYEGFPVLGDNKYGKPSNHSIALFASEIKLKHPVQKEAFTISAKLPQNHPWNMFQF